MKRNENNFGYIETQFLHWVRSYTHARITVQSLV